MLIVAASLARAERPLRVIEQPHNSAQMCVGLGVLRVQILFQTDQFHLGDAHMFNIENADLPLVNAE